jgi:hypothetical protein
MSRARGATILLLTLALAAFTFGCSDDGGGTAGSGGTAGGGGEGGAAGIRADFETSLHNTRAGQSFWYAAENNGFESLTAVPYEDLTCQGCHNKEDASWAGVPSCADCHEAGSEPPKHLEASTCKGCHARQNAEASNLQEADFHAATYSCVDCHKSNDVHGNGEEYDSMLRPGAIAARCTDCHSAAGAGGAGGAGGIPGWPDDSYHGGQHTAVDCALCHTETVISCVNCHLEEDVDNGVKCASAQVFNWKFVMKWDKEGDGNEVFHPATIMTVKYNCDRPQTDPPFAACPNPDDGKKTIAVFAPYYAHTVTEQAMDNILARPAGPAPYDEPGCTYCHGAENCDTILAADADNRQKLIEFNGGAFTNPMSGLIPLDDEYKNRYAIDFAEWQEGAGTGCPTPEMPKPLVSFETGPDLWQTGADTAAPKNTELGRPLTPTEFEKFCPAP